jgi:FkbM family methyltransferase
MLKRRLAKTKHLLETEGPRAVLREISDSLRLRMRLKAAAHKKSVQLDGCTISLQGIPDSFTKLFLLDGRYELPERRAVKQHLRRDLPVIELGGSLGVVACITNKLLVNPAAHVVVEANPFAIPQLTLNKNANDCKFEIVNCALAYDTDSVTFCPTVDLAANSIESDGSQLYETEKSVTVPAIRLGELVATRGFSEFSLVCDIEGKEDDLISNELDVIRMADVIVMETHARIIGEERNQLLLRKLTDIGFTVIEKDGFVLTLRKSGGRNFPK